MALKKFLSIKEPLRNHGIKTTFGERLATQDAPQTFAERCENAMMFQTIDAIFGTAWIKTAAWQQEWRQNFLVPTDEKNKSFFKQEVHRGVF
jgi:hypothetical protein